MEVAWPAGSRKGPRFFAFEVAGSLHDAQRGFKVTRACFRTLA